MRRFLVYALLGLFFASERLFRQPAATSLIAEQSDRRSTMRILRALSVSALGLLLAPLLDAVRIGRLPRSRMLFRTGVTAMVTGLVIRAWAMRALGIAYTRTLHAVDDQRLIQDGPFRLIRHPGYLGTLLVWLGAALALANGITIAVVGMALIPAYGQRISAEEAMLAELFGSGYETYQSRTWRLVPFFY
ncbi:MAG TPA: isoprenylcysteine carboxylmethyltransferase family protein [Nitrolancea sp.]|nr:isoprenylcysteine carboxylmethyltransferase family protein [Nitrolancea sp.]